MSDMLNDIGHCALEARPACAAIRTLLHPKDKDLGGVKVRRLLPNEPLKSLGPFVFFDHLGPARFPPGQGIDVDRTLISAWRLSLTCSQVKSSTATVSAMSSQSGLVRLTG